MISIDLIVASLLGVNSLNEFINEIVQTQGLTKGLIIYDRFTQDTVDRIMTNNNNQKYQITWFTMNTDKDVLLKYTQLLDDNKKIDCLFVLTLTIDHTFWRTFGIINLLKNLYDQNSRNYIYLSVLPNNYEIDILVKELYKLMSNIVIIFGHTKCQIYSFNMFRIESGQIESLAIVGNQTYDDIFLNSVKYNSDGKFKINILMQLNSPHVILVTETK